MKKTNIQWCHSTVNPVMGCDGCELWPGKAQVVAGIQSELQHATNASRELGPLCMPDLPALILLTAWI